MKHSKRKNRPQRPLPLASHSHHSLIEGFDYRTDKSVSMTAREWRVVVRAEIKAGGTVARERRNKVNDHVPYPPEGETVVLDNRRPRRPMLEIYAELRP